MTDFKPEPFTGGLVNKNIRINGHRTSVRLDSGAWRALEKAARDEKCSVHDLCSAVSILKGKDTSFSATLRAFLLSYYRNTGNADPQVRFVKQVVKELDKKVRTYTIRRVS
jgi:predicted DNA-binding ribbon-helix-helix protein